MPPSFRDIPNVPDVIDQVGVEQIITVFANLSGLDQSKFILNSRPYIEQGGYSNATVNEALRILKQPAVVQDVVPVVTETPAVVVVSIQESEIKPHPSEVADKPEIIIGSRQPIIKKDENGNDSIIGWTFETKKDDE